MPSPSSSMRDHAARLRQRRGPRCRSTKWTCEPPTMAPSERPTKLMRVGLTPTGTGPAAAWAMARPAIDFVSWIRSASPCRRLSRLVSGLGKLMKWPCRRRVDHAVVAGCARACCSDEVDVERALRRAEALRRVGRCCNTKRARRVRDAVQRQVHRRDDEARVGESIRHRKRVRAVTRDAVLQDDDRPAAGGGVARCRPRSRSAS